MAYAAKQFKVQERTVKEWCKEFGLVPALPSGPSGNGDASMSSVDRLSLSGSSMAEAARDPDVALAHVKRLATQCPEDSNDPDELGDLALDLRLLSGFLREHAERIRHPDLARLRAEARNEASSSERPTVPEMRRKLQWRFGDDTAFIIRRTEYECPATNMAEWFWAFQISLPDGRLICDYGDTGEARWRVLERLVVRWTEADDEDVDQKAILSDSSAHQDFLEYAWWTRHPQVAP